MSFKWWLIPILLLAFWLGARGLDADPLWADEYHSIYDAGGSIYGPLTPGDIWQRIEGRNPWHAPGYFILLSGWGRLVGWDAAVGRALSLLLGLLVIAWTYRLGRDVLGDERAGVFAAALLATLAVYVHYLHELRMYTLLLLFMLVTVWLYLRMIRPRYTPRPAEWLGLFGGAVGLLYTHFFGGLPLAVLGLYHMLFVRRERKWSLIFITFVLAALVFLPWINVLRAGIRETQQDDDLQAAALTTREAVARFVELFSNDSLIGLALVAALSVVAVGLLLRPNPKRRGVAQMLFLGLLLIGAILAINAVLPLMPTGRARYWLLGLPFLTVVAGAGLAWLSGRSHLAAYAVVLVWVGVGVQASLTRAITITVDGSGYVFPLHTVTRVIAANQQANDFLLGYLPAEGNPPHSYNRMAPLYFAGLPLEYDFEQISDDIERDAAAGQQIVRGKDHFWLAYRPDYDAGAISRIETALRAEHDLCYTPVDRPDLFIGFYTGSSVCCQPALKQTEPVARYGDGIQLAGLTALPDTVSDMLPLRLSWLLADDVPPHTYSVAYHVVDGAGELVAQADAGLRPLAFSCYDQPIDLSGVEPGSYTLRIGVYAWQTGERLSGTLTASGETADMLPVATFEVE